MKTIKKNKELKRVKDDIAEQMVRNEGWKYCPKSEWKDSKPRPIIQKEVIDISK